MKRARRAPAFRAFSLIEIVLALAVISFALLAVFGLISISLKADRESSSDTVMAGMRRTVMGDLRTGTFANLPDVKYYYFDRDGLPCNPASALAPAQPTSAYYECKAALVDDKNAPPEPAYDVSENLKNATLTFTWPVLSGSRPHTEVFYCDIANYGN